MARKPFGVEFMNILHKFTGLKMSAFARACGKQPSNMTGYLSGSLIPSEEIMKSSVEHLYEWNVQPIREVVPIPKNLNTLPKAPGIYVLYDSGGSVIYIGQAASFRSEIRQTLNRKVPVPLRLGPSLRKASPKMGELATRLSLYRVESERLRQNFEALLIRIFINQTHNSNIGKFS